MDDTFRALIITLVLGSVGYAHAELTYVSPETTQRLERDFVGARAADAKGVLAKPTWTCDMYGVRTKMQIEHDLTLYRFTRGTDAQKPLVNSGDHPIHDYQTVAGAFAGTDTRGLRDELRLTKDGHLVGKLSLPAQKLTIAYAVCTGS